MMKQLLQNQL
uniref:Uncharacterized protein n=1 Tax=Rhizophora mucronata TaxID=61149 RepID=A0A2P2NUY7_RHIMU